MAVSEGKKTERNSPVEWNLLGADSIEPKLPALMRIQMSSAAAITNMKGAPKACRQRMDSTPRQTTARLSSQKPRKQAQSAPLLPAAAGQVTASIAWIAVPPIHDCTPNGARIKTGKGIPYLAPACALSNMGTSTMRLPSNTVPMACFQSMPLAMSDEAS